MEGLPDEMLLAVMQLLDVRSLFACRLVNKRIGALALHPCVWRRQKLEAGKCRCPCCCASKPRSNKMPRSPTVLMFDENCSLIDSSSDDDSESSSDDDDAPVRGGGTVGSQKCAVLRLAPCLRKMTVHLASKGHCVANKNHLPPYASTRCAVKELELHVSTNTAMRAALLIRNQEALGRLRHLTLHLRGSHSRDEASMLLATVASTGVLEKLVVKREHDYEGSDSFVLQRTASVSSLAYFECDFYPNFQTFYNLVLGGHAATLREVYLRAPFAPTATKTATLLGAMPNLRVLHCPQLPGMDKVAKAESLRVLTLVIETGGSLPYPELTKFFRRASQLQEVRLSLPACNIGLHLVQAPLATSRLETLTVMNRFIYEVPVDAQSWSAPISALPSLPALRRVELSGVSVDVDGLLLNIGPDTAPALRSLQLKLIPTALRCPRAWLHSHAVKVALTVNPLLHIQLSCQPHAGSPDAITQTCTDCKSCILLDCHQQLGFHQLVCQEVDWDVYPPLSHHLDCQLMLNAHQTICHHQGRKGGLKSVPIVTRYELGLFSHDPKHKCSCPEYHTDSGCWVHIT